MPVNQPLRIRTDRAAPGFNPPMVRLGGVGAFDELAADIPLQMFIEEDLDILAGGVAKLVEI